MFADRDMPEGLGAQAAAFDRDGEFLQDLIRDSTVSGLETTFMVLLGHGVSIDFDVIVSSVPKFTTALGLQASDLARRLSKVLEERARSMSGVAQ